MSDAATDPATDAASDPATDATGGTAPPLDLSVPAGHGPGAAEWTVAALAGARPVPLGVGIIGFGFMGRMHAAAWTRAARDGFPVTLRALYRGRPSSAAGAGPDAPAGNLEIPGDLVLDPPPAETDSAQDLLGRDDVDVVSICTPTDTHVDLAIAALDAGKHVLVEKPVAIQRAAIDRLRAAAAAHPDLVCMPAMCIRFWPAWRWLAIVLREQRFGPVHGARFVRMGARPDWAPDFYRNPARSGGVLHDLHVHDADFMRLVFGTPASVTAVGDDAHLSVLHHHEGGDLAAAEIGATASWALQPGAGFRMRFLVVCAQATIEYDAFADPPLVVHAGDATHPVPGVDGDGYDGEVRHLIDRIVRRASGERGPEVALGATLDDAATACAILDAIARSRATGQTVPMTATD